MRAFSQLLDDLVYTRSRNSKLKLIGDYLKETPDPDRGIALAALTGTLDIPAVKPAQVRATGRGAGRSRPALHEPRLCRRHGRDRVAAVAGARGRSLRDRRRHASAFRDAVERLRLASRADAPAMLAHMLDHLDVSGRFALLKLATGALRVGISARLAKQALADAFGLDVEQVEEVWHGLKPPYHELFDWGEGKAPQPTAQDVPVFRPFMLAHPLEDAPGQPRRLCRRMEMGRDPHPAGPCRRTRRGSTAARATTFRPAFPMSPSAFAVPRCSTANCWSAATDAGRRGGELQRASAAARAQESSAPRCRASIPAFVRLYDILFDGEEDLRAAAVERPAAHGLKRLCRGSMSTGSTCRN